MEGERFSGRPGWRGGGYDQDGHMGAWGSASSPPPRWKGEVLRLPRLGDAGIYTGGGPVFGTLGGPLPTPPANFSASLPRVASSRSFFLPADRLLWVSIRGERDGRCSRVQGWEERGGEEREREGWRPTRFPSESWRSRPSSSGSHSPLSRPRARPQLQPPLATVSWPSSSPFCFPSLECASSSGRRRSPCNFPHPSCFFPAMRVVSPTTQALKIPVLFWASLRSAS